MPKQVVLIHGGDTFPSYEAYLDYLKTKEIDFVKHGLRVLDWQDKFAERLGPEYKVIRPDMPSKRNAKYLEWKIWFEKFMPFIESEVILIGGSLGGIFLAKYLAENDFPKKIKALFLLAAPFQDKDRDYMLLDFTLPASLEKTNSQPEKIFLYHSKDDTTVPFEEVSKYKQMLPKATLRVFEDRGHFNNSEFPELVEDIRSIQI